MDLIHLTYFCGIQQMEMKDRSLIDEINLTFVAFSAMAIHHSLLAWKTGQFQVSPGYRPAGGAQRKCHTTNIHLPVNNACRDVFRHLEADFGSSSPQVQGKEALTIGSIIHTWIDPSGMDPVMAQHHKDQGGLDEDFLGYIPEALKEHPNNSFNGLSSYVAASKGSMQFSAVLPMGHSAITSSSQPVHWSNSNSNSNEITNIPNITSIQNTE